MADARSVLVARLKPLNRHITDGNLTPHDLSRVAKHHRAIEGDVPRSKSAEAAMTHRHRCATRLHRGFLLAASSSIALLREKKEDIPPTLSNFGPLPAQKRGRLGGGGVHAVFTVVFRSRAGKKHALTKLPGRMLYRGRGSGKLHGQSNQRAMRWAACWIPATRFAARPRGPHEKDAEHVAFEPVYVAAVPREAWSNYFQAVA